MYPRVNNNTSVFINTINNNTSVFTNAINNNTSAKYDQQQW